MVYQFPYHILLTVSFITVCTLKNEGFKTVNDHKLAYIYQLLHIGCVVVLLQTKDCVVLVSMSPAIYAVWTAVPMVLLTYGVYIAVTAPPQS